MYQAFLQTHQPFSAFGSSHFLPLIIIGVIGIILIAYGKSISSEEDKHTLLILISCIPALSVLINLAMRIYEGSFTIEEDLPFHICRFVALIAPFAVWKRSKFWMGILYFWILAGTLNANISPDISYNFPHWNYFTYWGTHSFLVIIPIYYVLVLKISMRLKDLRNAFLMANVFLLFTLSVNGILGSNYMYSREKPPVASLLDYLGPWPVYLITGQVLACVLFFLLYLPFIGRNKQLRIL